MARKVSVYIEAKNMMARELGKARAALTSFGKSAARVGKTLAVGFLSAAAAVTGFAVKALRAWEIQKSAELDAESALRSHGDAVAENMEHIKRYTAAMQQEIGVGDEVLIKRAARLRQMGVLVDSLEAATKATVALERAGMGEEQAIKAVAQANAGNYETLQRIIPALRSVTDETERAAIVNDFLTRNYQAQKDQLNTVGGQWIRLKNNMGDAWEVIGEGIDSSGELGESIAKLSAWVVKLADRISKEFSEGLWGSIMAAAKETFERLRHGFMMASNSAEIGFAAIGDGAETAFNYIKNVVAGAAEVWKSKFFYMRDLAIAVWEAIKSPIKKGFEAPDTGPMEDAIRDYGKALKGQDAVVSKRLEAALATRAGMQQRHADRIAEIHQAQVDGMLASTKDATDVEISEMERINIARENAAKRKEELEKQHLKLTEQVAKKERDAKAAALQEEIRGLEQVEGKREELAKKTVRQIMDEMRAKEQAQAEGDRQFEQAARKAERLRKRQERGHNIGKAGERFLAAFGDIEAAREGPAKALEQAKEQLAELQQQGQTLIDMRADLANIAAELKPLTEMLAAEKEGNQKLDGIKNGLVRGA